MFALIGELKHSQYKFFVAFDGTKLLIVVKILRLRKVCHSLQFEFIYLDMKSTLVRSGALSKTPFDLLVTAPGCNFVFGQTSQPAMNPKRFDTGILCENWTIKQSRRDLSKYLSHNICHLKFN